jgi:oxepin-CoA hydrolase / 3-oxo-5,6-dehydrosuberyl-CoA semialdehyde dehydrogenase
VRFVAEQDSLNASVLGPTPRRARPNSTCSSRKSREMTVKAGQKCTAIRRAMAPAEHLDAVEEAMRASGWRR